MAAANRFLVSCSTLGKIAMLLSPFRTSRASTPEQARELQSVCAGLCVMHRWECELIGSFPSGSAVIVSNHQSYVDPIIVCAQYPCLPIAKAEVSRWPVVGTCTRKLGVQFMQRGRATDGARMLRDVRSTLDEGTSIFNFPEGTTTRASLKTFSPGIFGVAKHAGVPVVPLCISLHDSMPWVGDASFVPHYLNLIKLALTQKEPSRVRVEVGPALDPKDFADARSLSRAAHDWIEQRQALWAPPSLAAASNPQLGLIASAMTRGE